MTIHLLETHWRPAVAGVARLFQSIFHELEIRIDRFSISKQIQTAVQVLCTPTLDCQKSNQCRSAPQPKPKPFRPQTNYIFLSSNCLHFLVRSMWLHVWSVYVSMRPLISCFNGVFREYANDFWWNRALNMSSAKEKSFLVHVSVCVDHRWMGRHSSYWFIDCIG